MAGTVNDRLLRHFLLESPRMTRMSVMSRSSNFQWRRAGVRARSVTELTMTNSETGFRTVSYGTRKPMKPPRNRPLRHFLLEKRVMIAKVSFWPSSTYTRVNGPRTGQKVTKSDGKAGKVAHFWTTFWQESVLNAALRRGSDQQ